MTRLKVALPGAAGKMGRMIARVIAETPEVELTAALERPGSPHLGADAGTLAGVPPFGVAITSEPEGALARAEVAIDFTAPEATVALAARAAERGGPALVIGTTGLGPAEREKIAAAAARVPIVRSANMSLGVNVLFGLLAQAARALPGYDVEIVELHHRMKKDAPSGTALEMARVLAEALGRDLATDLRHGREGQPGARTPEEIGLHAVRGGDVVGEHTAYFFGLGERLAITHQASSRETFARGAVRAAIWLRGRPPGLYDMQDVLGLER